MNARKQYPFRLSEDDIRFLDELAKHYGNRSEALRASIRIGIDKVREQQAELYAKKQAELYANGGEKQAEINEKQV